MAAKIGDTVFDGPSQAFVTIIEISEDGEYVKVDAQPDPTGDGAFPDSWRNWFELGEHLRGKFDY